MTRTIAYLTGEYPRATDTFIQREVSELRTQGFTVHTCSIRRTGPEHLVGPEQRTEAAGTFHVIEAAKRPVTLLRAHFQALATPKRYIKALILAIGTAPPGLRGMLYQLFYFLEAAVLAQHLRARGVSHLHNHIAKASCTVAMLASALSGIPYSFTIHGPDIFFEPHHWRIDAKVARAKFVACISEFCRSQVMIFADPAHWTKLHIVHCGVIPDRYADRPPRPKGRQNMLFVGRLAVVKGMPVLLDALRILSKTHPKARLTIIGDGPDRGMLEAESTGLNVDYVGYKSQSEVAEALAQTDIFVLPSFAEGVPVVLMEAMAASVPVVTTRIAGVPELVEDGVSGHLVPPGDAAALAQAITRILDTDAPQTMGAAGRARVMAEFDIRAEARWLGHLIESYSSNAPTPPKRPQVTP